MEHSVVVYTREEHPIPIDEILRRLSARGLQVAWRYVVLSERGHPAGWTVGYFLPEGQTGMQVSAFTEAVKPWLVQETLRAYGDALTTEHRAALGAARTRYQFALEPRSATGLTPILTNVVDIVAGGDALIVDGGCRRVTGPSEYRRWHRDSLSGEPS